jgi:hypothetical protein
MQRLQVSVLGFSLLFVLTAHTHTPMYSTPMHSNQTARREAARLIARKRWVWAAQQTIKRSRVVGAFKSSQPEAPPQGPTPLFARERDPDPVGDEGTLQGKVYNFVFAKNEAGER